MFEEFPIFKNLNLKEDDLINLGVNPFTLDSEQLKAVANRVSDLMLEQLSDCVDKACREQKIIYPYKDEE